MHKKFFQVTALILSLIILESLSYAGSCVFDCGEENHWFKGHCNRNEDCKEKFNAWACDHCQPDILQGYWCLGCEPNACSPVQANYPEEYCKKHHKVSKPIKK